MYVCVSPGCVVLCVRLLSFLFVLLKWQSIVDEDVLVYRAIAAPRANVSGRLQVIFVKVCHDVVVREKKSAKPKPVSDSVQG